MEQILKITIQEDIFDIDKEFKLHMQWWAYIDT